MLANGFHDVPSGHVATIVTYLEMTQAPERARPALPDGLTITQHSNVDLAWYRDLFSRVGAPWLWWSRLLLGDVELTEILQSKDVEILSLDLGGTAEGLLELDFREAGSCELAYFGLTPSLVGKGAGRALMARAITSAFSRPISRFHVHTCTLDSPQALAFYIRSGFTPVRQEVEIAKDPRLSGLLPMDAGPHVPIIR